MIAGTARTSPLPEMKDRPSATPMKHYCSIYKEMDPMEISERTGIQYDVMGGCFIIRLLGCEYEVSFPEFSVIPLNDATETNSYEELLIIRYLIEGQHALGLGKQLSYEELPWGSVYMTNFRGRVISRMVREFGKDANEFASLVETMQGLRYERIEKGDVGYRIEFINDLYLSIILYEGDEEFPASCQILFDDNFKFAFSAEDVAVVGDILIGRLKGHRKQSGSAN